MLQFIGINKEKEICLPKKEYSSGTDKYTYGCQMHSTYAYYCWAKSLLASCYYYTHIPMQPVSQLVCVSESVFMYVSMHHLQAVKHPYFSYFFKTYPYFSYFFKKKNAYFSYFFRKTYISKFGQWSNLHIKFKKNHRKLHIFFLLSKIKLLNCGLGHQILGSTKKYKFKPSLLAHLQWDLSMAFTEVGLSLYGTKTLRLTWALV